MRLAPSNNYFFLIELLKSNFSMEQTLSDIYSYNDIIVHVNL